MVPPPLANAAEAVAAVAPTSSLLTRVAAEASVELVLVRFGSGHATERRLLRHMPQALAAAVERLQRGPG